MKASKKKARAKKPTDINEGFARPLTQSQRRELRRILEIKNDGESQGAYFDFLDRHGLRSES